MKASSILTVVASIAAGALTATLISTKISEDKAVTPTLNSSESAFRTVSFNESGSYPDFTYAAESCVDAVVYVKVTVRDSYSRTPNSIFDYFFGFDPQVQPRERVGSGSGVIIREDGYIVTNNHVVEGASKIEVTLNSNQSYEATLIGTDPATDVALLKIDATSLPYIPFGNSDDLRLGEWVLAIGSPYNLRGTITAGIVSAKGRSMPQQEQGGSAKIESFIQTDAAVNPGNSGGALVNREGQLVGMNTAIYSQTGSYSGYSFAVPSNMIQKIISDLIDFGSVKRAMLGVTMQEIDSELAKELKLSKISGVYIYDVASGSAADEAGIKKGDVITRVGSVEITSSSKMQEVVNGYRPGDSAQIELIRGGKTKTVQATFKGSSAENGSKGEDGSIAFYGSYIKDAPAEKLATFGMKQGVEIVKLGPGKLQEAGASEGCIILYVNDVAVGSTKEVLDVVSRSRRSVYIEGLTSSGRAFYWGFAK